MSTLEEEVAERWQTAFGAIWFEIWEWKMQFVHTGMPPRPPGGGTDWTLYLSSGARNLWFKAENATLRLRLAEARKESAVSRERSDCADALRQRALRAEAEVGRLRDHCSPGALRAIDTERRLARPEPFPSVPDVPVVEPWDESILGPEPAAALEVVDFLRQTQRRYQDPEDLARHLEALAEAVDPAQPGDDIPLTEAELEELEELRRYADLCELGNNAMAADKLRRMFALTRRRGR